MGLHFNGTRLNSNKSTGVMMTTVSILYALPFALGAAILVVATSANAGRPEPVPLYGSYDTYLDHSKQTFNGRPDVSTPSTQAASFTTVCVASGCVAHWLLLTKLTENPNAPTLFDYHWVNGRWESTGEYPFRCNDGSKVTATRFDFITPNGDGSFFGERTFTVKGVGCPGDGPGKYQLPFKLTPKN